MIVLINCMSASVAYCCMPHNQANPCRTVLLRKDAFDEREMDFYEALYTQSQAQFGAYVESGTVLNNYAHIFDLLIRLRQVCLTPLY